MFISALIIIIILFGVYQKLTNRYCNLKTRLNNKTVVVTGGTAGIGLEVARDVASRGARVIIACPDEHEGVNARKTIISQTGNTNVHFEHLDLASLTSVRGFANKIIQTERRLDVLINNAGVGIPFDESTDDGINYIMQVNYFGTFLLTILMLPLLKTTTKYGKVRIITTGSFMHWFGWMDVSNLYRTNYWYKLQLYSNSKTCLVLFAEELAKKLRGTNVVINSVDPGLVATRIYASANYVFGVAMKILLTLLFKTSKQGAQTTIFAAVDQESAEYSGVYYKNCGRSILVRSADEKTLRALWEESARLVKLSDAELQRCLS